jgi:hypothetical protein
MATLLGRLVAAQRPERAAPRAVPLDYLARLLRAFDRHWTAANPMAPECPRGGRKIPPAWCTVG